MLGCTQTPSPEGWVGFSLKSRWYFRRQWAYPDTAAWLRTAAEERGAATMRGGVTLELIVHSAWVPQSSGREEGSHQLTHLLNGLIFWCDQLNCLWKFDIWLLQIMKTFLPPTFQAAIIIAIYWQSPTQSIVSQFTIMAVMYKTILRKKVFGGRVLTKMMIYADL